MATRRTTRWPLLIEYFDQMPRQAREALANSLVLGNGSPELLIAKAPGDVMGERGARADAAFLAGDNTITHPKVSKNQINAILCGTASRQFQWRRGSDLPGGRSIYHLVCQSDTDERLGRQIVAEVTMRRERFGRQKHCYKARVWWDRGDDGHGHFPQGRVLPNGADPANYWPSSWAIVGNVKKAQKWSEAWLARWLWQWDGCQVIAEATAEIPIAARTEHLGVGAVQSSRNPPPHIRRSKNRPYRPLRVSPTHPNR